MRAKHLQAQLLGKVPYHNSKNTNSEFLIHINYLMVLLSYYNTESYNQIIRCLYIK